MGRSNGRVESGRAHRSYRGGGRMGCHRHASVSLAEPTLNSIAFATHGSLLTGNLDGTGLVRMQERTGAVSADMFSTSNEIVGDVNPF